MNTNSIVVAIDAEITRLQKVRALLSSVKTSEEDTTISHKEPKRKMSKAGRESIAAAQRKRWAKVRREERSLIKALAARKAAPKKATKKRVAKKPVPSKPVQSVPVEQVPISITEVA